MKKTQSTKSSRSVRSMISEKTAYNSETDTTLDIVECIVGACERFNCPKTIQVVKSLQRDDFYKTLKKGEPAAKYKKITVAPVPINQSPILDTDPSIAGPLNKFSKNTLVKDTVLMTALYDTLNRLVELEFSKVRNMPRILMQVIGLLVPFSKQLYRITIKESKIDKYTIYELYKMLPLSSITELCLDGSTVLEANYGILLDAQLRLRNLSLSKCLINDDACKQIVARLRFLEPSEASLVVLNLSSNHISDEGAKYIGEALRTNRHLRYLNLADNHITDDGARHIFDILTEFPLTNEEIFEKRHRYSDYLKAKRAMYIKCLNELDTKSDEEFGSSLKRKSVAKKKIKPVTRIKGKGSVGRESKINIIIDEYTCVRAEMMVDELLGEFKDPFSPSSVKLNSGLPHCIGNFVLCYLNLSYNNLTYLSVKKLNNIVIYQQANKVCYGMGGLIKLVLEGNYMPEACSELISINETLQSNIVNYGNKAFTDRSRRKSAIK